MTDEPKTFKGAVSRFKKAGYFPFCSECDQPLFAWGVHGPGFHMCGSYPVYGDPPDGVEGCPECGGRTYWLPWATARYGVSESRARCPYPKKVHDSLKACDLLEVA